MNFLFNKSLNFEYKSEFETMILFADSSLARFCLEDMKATKTSKVSAAKLTIKSTNLREQGNQLFKVSPTKNALTAARYYTKAIFAAPLGSEALSMAHANRAMALQQFGLFGQAYDDCTCALEQGYPMHMQHKIITRQGYCALQLGDATLLKQHLDTLNDYTLNKSFATDVQKLQEGLDKLQLKKPKNVQAPELQMELYRDKTKILKSPTKGRFMVASKPIEANELIFSERATSFVPPEEVLICQQCASAQLIPFPCYRCGGKVVYCSVKCRKDHETTHGYECMAYQIGLFPTKGDGHLSLRVMLDGIQQVIPFLRSKHTAKEIWHELTDKDSKLLQNEHLEYVQVLRRVTHVEKKPTEMIIIQAKNAGMILEYLSAYTNFFNIFKDTTATRSDWELVIGSLILRHIGQNGANAIEWLCIIETPESMEFKLMDDNLWNGPLHIRRGYLHKKIMNTPIAFTANFHYFGLMNHSCESSVKVKFTGRYISAVATKQIKSNEEVFVNYVTGMDHLTKESRRKHLKESFHFECACLKCTSVKEDQDDYVEHHRYRCEHSKCRSVFTPIVSEQTLCWWTEADGTNKMRCSKCNSIQHNLLACVAKIHELLMSVERAISRNEVFKTLRYLDRWLLDKHYLKYVLSRKIIEKCLTAYNGGAPFTRKDFVTLVEMCKYLMTFYKTDPLGYALPMSFLWDIIALKKYKCKPEEMQEMLKGIEALTDDLKTVCTNYYNDYLISTTIQ